MSLYKKNTKVKYLPALALAASLLFAVPALAEPVGGQGAAATAQSTAQSSGATAQGTADGAASGAQAAGTSTVPVAVPTAAAAGAVSTRAAAAVGPGVAKAEPKAEETEAEAAPQPSPGQAVADFACRFVGNPYRFGGTSLTGGADCSGFVLSVYANFGVALPHSSAEQRSVGRAVGSLAEAQPGDIVAYSGHVGIYIGNGMIVHASNRRDGIKVSPANYNRILSIRRMV